MMNITTINKIFLSAFLLLLPIFSMEPQLPKPALVRTKSERDLLAGSSQFIPSIKKSELKSELFVKPLPIDYVNIRFPDEAIKLEEAIEKEAVNNHTVRIRIYIPRTSQCLNEQTKIDPLECNFDKLLRITHLWIYHSMGSERGYWKTAIEALKPFVSNAKSLQQVILSYVLVEDLIAVIPNKTRIVVDCSCCYSATDTIYPQPCLEEIRDFTEAELKKKYPDRNILVVKAANTENLFNSKFKF